MKIKDLHFRPKQISKEIQHKYNLDSDSLFITELDFNNFMLSIILNYTKKKKSYDFLFLTKESLEIITLNQVVNKDILNKSKHKGKKMLLNDLDEEEANQILEEVEDFDTNLTNYNDTIEQYGSKISFSCMTKSVN